MGKAFARHGRAIEFLLFGVSTAAFQGSRLVLSLFAVRILDPTQFGAWGIFVTLLTYSNYSNMGLLSGANREIPLAIGAGAHARAHTIERTALAGALISGTAVAGAFLIAATLWRVQFAWLMALTLAIQQLYLLYQVSLRSRLEFNRASAQQLLLSAAVLAIGLMFLNLGLGALILAQLAAYLLGAIIVAALWRRGVQPQLDLQLARDLVRTGFPIMLGGLVFAALTTADRWVVAGLIGGEALGHYTLAALIASGLLLATVVVGQQFYPRMAMQYGATGRSASVFAMALRQCQVQAMIVLPLAGMVAVGAHIGIPIWAPAYGQMLPMLSVMLIGLIIVAFGTAFGSVLIVVGEARLYVYLQIASLLLQVVLAVLALAISAGPVGVAWCSAISYATYTGGAFLLCHRAVKADPV